LIRADHEAVTIGELAERVGRHHTTVSRQVTALEQQGFVRRVVDDGDGRRSLVHVTDKGREETGRIAEARRAGLTAVFEGWSDRERRDLTRLLAKLVTGLETVVATVPAGEQA
jgi:DNA-binding MarR family transcriptional regulator